MIREYPSIARQIERVRLASHGCKRGQEKRLVKMRLASMKREVARLRSRRTAAVRSAS